MHNRVDKADPIHGFLTRALPDRPHPPFVRPFNYVKFAIIVTAVLGLVSFGVVAAPYAVPVLQSRNLWAAISLIAILLFTSGYMFNYIRKVPYVTGDNKGRINYFIGGFQNQTGLETQIVAAICKLQRTRTLQLLLNTPLTSIDRRRAFICDHQPGVEGSSHGECSTTTNCRVCMGRCHVWHVQHAAQRLPHQERRLSFLAATILDQLVSCMYQQIDRQHKCIAPFIKDTALTRAG